MWFLRLALVVMVSCCHSAAAETWRLKGGESLEVVADNPQEQYLHAIAELKKLVQEGDAGEVKAALEQIKEEFPDRVGPDLELFVQGEVRYWQDRYGKALVKYEKLLKDYPGSEYAGLALQREFDMAQEYLEGRKKVVLGILKLSGYDEGVEIMEKISDRAGLDEPNGVGLRASHRRGRALRGEREVHRGVPEVVGNRFLLGNRPDRQAGPVSHGGEQPRGVQPPPAGETSEL